MKPSARKMKDSGVPWIGEIPKSWQVVKVKRLLLPGRQGCRIGPFGSALTLGQMVEVGYKVYGQENVIADNFDRGTRQISAAKYKEMKEYEITTGDILLTMMGTIGHCRIVPPQIAEGIMDSHLLRIRLDDTKMGSDFFRRALSESDMVKVQLDLESKGSIMSGLNSAIVKGLTLVRPPLPEQRHIAAFLDRKCGQIDGLIEKKERLIALLREQRQAIISRAVTKGLDPQAKMKDSGIPWIGEIPVGWEVAQLLRFMTSLTDGPFGSEMKSSHYTDDGVRVVRLQNIGQGVFNDTDKAFISTDRFAKLKKHDARTGDLLIAGLGDENHPVGRACVVPARINVAMVKADCFRARFDRRTLLEEFVACFLNSQPGQATVSQQLRGSTRSRMNLVGVRQLSIPIPPLQNQREIAEHIEKTENAVVGTILKTEHSIERLKEYRQALISAAVTGKIEVPEELDHDA